MVQNASKTSENEQETCQTHTFYGSVRIEDPKYNNVYAIRYGSDPDLYLFFSVKLFTLWLNYLKMKMVIFRLLMQWQRYIYDLSSFQ